MAGIKLKAEMNTGSIRKLAKLFPDMKVRVMARIGTRSHKSLKSLINSSGIDLTVYPKSADGRFTISNRVQRRGNAVTVKSFPLNLFENGRTLRNGKKEAPRKIITVKLRTVVNASLSSWVNQADREILEKEFKKIDNSSF